MRRVVIFGGTAEARVLAELVAAEPGVEVTTSLAGRTPEPRLPAGQVRIGGFGGPEGLAGWLREQRADAVVDATHPFAEAISRHAALAADAAGVPLLALRRPGWSPGEGDRWHWADTLAAAAALLPALGHRPFLTVGRQDLAAFAGLPLSCLARSIAPPPPPLPAHCRVLLDRGPFTLDAERALLQPARHRRPGHQGQRRPRHRSQAHRRPRGRPARTDRPPPAPASRRARRRLPGCRRAVAAHPLSPAPHPRARQPIGSCRRPPPAAAPHPGGRSAGATPRGTL